MFQTGWMKVEPLPNGDIELEDPASWDKSDDPAVYYAENPKRREVYCRLPEKEEEETARLLGRDPEPRCDYLLNIPAVDTVKFLELKGGNYPRNTRNAKTGLTEWEHGFYQLRLTMNALGPFPPECEIHCILCTSTRDIKKGRGYITGKKYRELVNALVKVYILGARDRDRLE